MPAEVPAVETTVSVAVPGVVPVIVPGVLTVQVGAVAPAPVTAQVNATAPVNPPEGVTVMVDVPLAPPAASVMGPLLVSAIPGVVVGAATVNTTEVVNARLPEVPVTVTT